MSYVWNWIFILLPPILWDRFDLIDIVILRIVINLFTLYIKVRLILLYWCRYSRQISFMTLQLTIVVTWFMTSSLNARTVWLHEVLIFIVVDKQIIQTFFIIISQRDKNWWWVLMIVILLINDNFLSRYTIAIKLLLKIYNLISLIQTYKYSSPLIFLFCIIFKILVVNWSDIPLT